MELNLQPQTAFGGLAQICKRDGNNGVILNPDVLGKATVLTGEKFADFVVLGRLLVGRVILQLEKGAISLLTLFAANPDVGYVPTAPLVSKKDEYVHRANYNVGVQEMAIQIHEFNITGYANAASQARQLELGVG